MTAMDQPMFQITLMSDDGNCISMEFELLQGRHCCYAIVRATGVPVGDQGLWLAAEDAIRHVITGAPGATKPLRIIEERRSAGTGPSSAQWIHHQYFFDEARKPWMHYDTQLRPDSRFVQSIQNCQASAAAKHAIQSWCRISLAVLGDANSVEALRRKAMRTANSAQGGRLEPRKRN